MLFSTGEEKSIQEYKKPHEIIIEATVITPRQGNTNEYPHIVKVAVHK